MYRPLGRISDGKSLTQKILFLRRIGGVYTKVMNVEINRGVDLDVWGYKNLVLR